MKAITVTLNPSFDTTLMLDGIHSDRANRVKDEFTEAGGKGINVTKVLCNLGVETEAFCIIGSEDSERFIEVLGDCDRFNFVYNFGKTRENITMRSGQQCVKVNRKGNTVSEKVIEQLEKDILSSTKNEDIIVVSGSAPRDFGSERLLEFCLKLKTSGARLVIDSEQLSFEQLSRLKPYMIKPNEHEIRTIFEKKENDEINSDELIKKLYGAGIENILLTLGGAGMTACLEGKMYRAKAAKIDVKSTVGAGDSAVAGFVAAKILKLCDEETIKLSSGCGTATAAKEGTGLADKAEAEKYASMTTVFAD